MWIVKITPMLLCVWFNSLQMRKLANHLYPLDKRKDYTAEDKSATAGINALDDGQGAIEHSKGVDKDVFFKLGAQDVFS